MKKFITFESPSIGQEEIRSVLRCINKLKIESIDIDDMQDYLIAKKI